MSGSPAKGAIPSDGKAMGATGGAVGLGRGRSTMDARAGAPLRLTCEVTCPRCGHRATEIMPTDACQYFYDCAGCGGVLKPKAGDCCVFCSFGDVACPPMQAGAVKPVANTTHDLSNNKSE